MGPASPRAAAAASNPFIHPPAYSPRRLCSTARGSFPRGASAMVASSAALAHGPPMAAAAGPPPGNRAPALPRALAGRPEPRLASPRPPSFLCDFRRARALLRREARCGARAPAPPRAPPTPLPPTARARARVPPRAIQKRPPCDLMVTSHFDGPSSHPIRVRAPHSPPQKRRKRKRKRKRNTEKEKKENRRAF